MPNIPFTAAQDGYVISVTSVDGKWNVVVQYNDGSSASFNQLDDVRVYACLQFKAGDLIGYQFPPDGCNLCSVGLVMPSQFLVTNSPLTENGNLEVGWNNVADKFYLGAPDGGGQPIFRQIDYNQLTNRPVVPTPYSLPIASSVVLGGIKVGDTLVIDGGGVLNTKGSQRRIIPASVWDYSLGNYGEINLTASRTSLSVINTVDLNYGVLYVFQDSTGGWNLPVTGVTPSNWEILKYPNSLTIVSFNNYNGTIYWRMEAQFLSSSMPSSGIGSMAIGSTFIVG